ncbi:MAG: hypothetical protein Q7J25_02990, partial [Vicinamibacterales bacterium]|nr:hypothetical protein [Vicinamibacterales bacterium]
MAVARALLLLAVTLSAACRSTPMTAPDVSPGQARQQAETWRAKHEVDYRREYVTIAGLHFLRDGSQTAGSDAASDVVLPEGAPATLGRFVLTGEAVRFEPDAGATVALDGTPVTAPVVLTDDGAPAADELTAGGIRMVVHRSGARKSLRVWDPDGPMAKGFLGFRWFDIEPAYRVVGRFIPDAAPRTVQIV